MLDKDEEMSIETIRTKLGPEKTKMLIAAKKAMSQRSTVSSALRKGVGSRVTPAASMHGLPAFWKMIF